MDTSQKSESELFAEIDKVKMDELGAKVVDGVLKDLHNPKFSLSQVGERNGISTGTVVQVARYHKYDPVTMRKAK